MSQRKELSSNYLQFLGKRGQSITGKRGNIELHHESVFTGFTGGRKKYNDFQAIPLTKEEHTDRHTYGLKWWDDVGNPLDYVYELLKDYKQSLSPFSFKDEEEFEEELSRVNFHLEQLL